MANNSTTHLLAPGPVNLHPEVRKILALPMIHHRTPEFDQILARVLKEIKSVFQTQEHVYLMTSTGSGGMEAALVNTLSPGDKILAIVSGKFGERWAQMAETFGAQVITHHVSWGEAVQVSEIEKILAENSGKNSPIRAVLCQACETSTATAHPIQELATLVKKYSDCLLLVDAITALGAYPLPMDEWGIDVLIGGSQKAFMLPTGLSLAAFSKKAQDTMEKAKMPRFYFDLRKEKKANANGETFYSSNVSLIRALDWVLQDIQAKTLDKHFAEIRKRAEFTRDFGQRLGLKLYSKAPSDSVTALLVPPHLDGQKIRADLEKDHSITIMGGQDQAKGKIIRIGHMGYIEASEQVLLIEKLAEVIHSFDKNLLPAAEQKNIVADARKYWGI